MPIYLPPISRREFLAKTLVAGAGALLAPELFAASKVDEHTWALLSDTHIAQDRTRVARGVSMMENFSAAIKEVLALRTRPAAALVCGDLAFSGGEKGDYKTFVEVIAPLRTARVPLHLALGNHDHRERFWEGVAGEKSLKRPLNDRHATLISTPRVNWFMLDSLDKTSVTPGVLGEEQLNWLEKSLDANPKKPALVVAHHNPDERQNASGLLDTNKLFEIIRPRKQVKAYIFGHTHVWSVKQDSSGIHLINLPTTAYRFHASLPAGWVLAKLEKKGMELTFNSLDHQHDEHGRVVALDWRS